MEFFLKILVICAVLPSSTCQSMEMAIIPSDLNYDYQHQDYQPTPIQTQIKEYRQIYDGILEEHSENPYQTHAPRLFNKLQNAFRLTRKYIQDKRVIDPEGKEQDQALYLSYLDTLYKAASKLNEDKEMTPLHFERPQCALCSYRHSVQLLRCR